MGGGSLPALYNYHWVLGGGVVPTNYHWVVKGFFLGGWGGEGGVYSPADHRWVHDKQDLQGVEIVPRGGLSPLSRELKIGFYTKRKQETAPNHINLTKNV